MNRGGTVNLSPQVAECADDEPGAQREPVATRRHDRRPAFPEFSRLFERVGQLQHAELVVGSANDLYSDREPFFGVAARDRDGREARRADS